MGGIFGIGGTASKTDRQHQLQSWGDLQNIFNFGFGQGTGQVKEGSEGLTKARNYFDAIMSGDQAQMAKVLAPQISTIQNQTQQRINTQSQFGNRSGGTNAFAQSTSEDATRAVQQLFDMLGPEAAKEVASISGTQEGLGSNLLGMAGSAAGTLGAQAGNTRQADLQNEANSAAGLTKTIMGLLQLA